MEWLDGVSLADPRLTDELGIDPEPIIELGVRCSLEQVGHANPLGVTRLGVFRHSVIQSFSHSVIQSFSHSVIQSFSHSVIQSFSHSVIQLFRSFLRLLASPSTIATVIRTRAPDHSHSHPHPHPHPRHDPLDAGTGLLSRGPTPGKSYGYAPGPARIPRLRHDGGT